MGSNYLKIERIINKLDLFVRFKIVELDSLRIGND